MPPVHRTVQGRAADARDERSELALDSYAGLEHGGYLAGPPPACLLGSGGREPWRKGSFLVAPDMRFGKLLNRVNTKDKPPIPLVLCG